jgi:hypothetical protein
LDEIREEAKMKKYLLAAVAALAIGAPAAKAGTWWTLNSQSSTCIPASQAAYASRDPAMASPFMLAEEMRRQGQLNRSIDFRRAGSNTAYGVYYDGGVTPYFVTKTGCEGFVSRARAGGDLP